MKYREEWLNENELQSGVIDHISDSLKLAAGFGNDPDYFHEVREQVRVGKGFADFLVFEPKKITICEVKITASVASLKQVLVYREALKLALYHIGHEITVDTYLIARYVEQDLVPLAAHAGVTVWQIYLNGREIVDVEVLDNAEEPIRSPNDTVELLKGLYKTEVVCE